MAKSNENKDEFETMFEHINNIRSNFRKYFGVNFSEFYDGQMTAFFGRPQIDYFAFSEWLNAPEGMSDKECIEERFGQEVARWFEQTFLIM